MADAKTHNKSNTNKSYTRDGGKIKSNTSMDIHMFEMATCTSWCKWESTLLSTQENLT